MHVIFATVLLAKGRHTAKLGGLLVGFYQRALNIRRGVIAAILQTLNLTKTLRQAANYSLNFC